MAGFPNDYTVGSSPSGRVRSIVHHKQGQGLANLNSPKIAGENYRKPQAPKAEAKTAEQLVEKYGANVPNSAIASSGVSLFDLQKAQQKAIQNNSTKQQDSKSSIFGN